MTSRNMVNYVIGFFVSLLVILTILVIAIELVTFDQNFYLQQYKRLNTAQKIGMSDEDLMRVTKQLTDYIRGRWKSLESITAEIKGIDRQVFNEREITHMLDVKGLFQLAARLRNFALIGIVVLISVLYFNSNKKPWSFFAVSYLIAAGLLLLVLITSIVIIRSNFTYYWDQFHYLFFDNDLWMLNPETDIMIQMVPEPFFYQAVLRVFSYFGTGLVIIGLVSFCILKRQKNMRQKLIKRS